MKAIQILYGETVTVDQWGDDHAVLSLGTHEPVMNAAQAEAVAAELVGMTGCYTEGDYKCLSDDGCELSPRRNLSGNVSFILTSDHGGSYKGEVILTKADTLALAMNLIRMVTHE